MAIRSIISILTFTFLLATSLTVFGQINFDTSKTAILEYNPKSRWPFDSTFKSAKLTQNQLQVVDSMLIVCVANYNTLLDNDHKQWTIDLKKRNYRKQLIVVTNDKGEKEVWVNCFCRVDNDKWKTKMFGVEDGGNCYFNFKINLTTNKYYELGVNGV